MTHSPTPPYRQPVSGSVETALAALERIAPDWDAEVAAGPDGASRRVEIPVLAGIRQGWVRGTLAARPGNDGAGSDLEFTLEESEYRLILPAVLLLACGAGGGLIAMISPLVPPLLRAAPYGGLLAVAVWFLVLRRLRHEGAAEFLAAVAEEVRDPLPDPPADQE